MRDREVDAVEVVDQNAEAEQPRDAPSAAWYWRLRGWARDRDWLAGDENFLRWYLELLFGLPC